MDYRVEEKCWCLESCQQIRDGDKDIPTLYTLPNILLMTPTGKGPFSFEISCLNSQRGTPF